MREFTLFILSVAEGLAPFTLSGAQGSGVEGSAPEGSAVERPDETKR